MELEIARHAFLLYVSCFVVFGLGYFLVLWWSPQDLVTLCFILIMVYIKPSL